MHNETDFRDIPLTQLRDDDENVRRTLTGVDELAAEIARDGILQPILVRPHPSENGAFQIVAGHRRVAAARKLALATVPAVVRELKDDDKQAAQLIENIHREDLSAVDIAYALRALMEKLNGRPADVAERISQTPNWVNKHLALLKLDPKLVSAIHRNRLGISLAREVAALAKAGDLNGALLAATELRDRSTNRAQLMQKTKAARTGEATSAVEASAVDCDRLFEKAGDGFEVRLAVKPTIQLDDSMERRIDALLGAFGKILGTAA
jgi:ParB family transcriptional regulator, chromosome partitioning protein